MAEGPPLVVGMPGWEDARVIRVQLVLAMVALFQVGACAVVRPWERALLAERSMDPANRVESMREDFVGHGLDIREGATGGRGVAGGGCGCN